MFPDTRLKRMRTTPAIRSLVREIELSARNLIQPYFVVEGQGRREKIKTMPGVDRLSVDQLIREIKSNFANGVRAVLLFGVEKSKDEKGGRSWAKDGLVQKAAREIRNQFQDSVVVITDVCLCGFLKHGHCGIVRGGKLDNDRTNYVLGRIAVSHAVSGADFVAPSSMADGQVGSIRRELDLAGFPETGIWSYGVKFASGLYGPFRDVLGSSPKFGDRKSYQLDYGNVGDALREAEEDVREGADVVMVKPAFPYLDIIYQIRQAISVPTAVYQVSGEYALLKCAARDGLSNERDIVFESLTAMKRAGAAAIVTYYANEVAQWLTQ